MLLGIFSPKGSIEQPENYFAEFQSLVDTAGIDYDHALQIKLRSIDKSRYLTKGKLEELKAFCDENNVQEVVCSALFSPLQERNLETYLDCLVVDREFLILEIFKRAAHTAEGKIQIEMAEIEFYKTRMAGKGREFAQQEGRIGARGPGETAKEHLRRFFADRLRHARKRLDDLRKVRVVQRKRRLESKTPMVCLVGYTNAGKSSILNRLTASDVLAEDKLFATLDTTIRELYLGPGKKLLVSDTVGFISNLPHHLVEAFRSTLDELMYAKVLLHVVDARNDAWPNQIAVVLKTLEDLNVTAPMVYLFNKMDMLDENEQLILMDVAQDYEPHLFVSATSKAGIAPLLKYLMTVSENDSLKSRE